MKKSLALILALMMVLSMFTMGITVSAADKPAGAKAISTVDELKNMAADTYYYLTADIYLGSPSEHAEMTEPSTDGAAEELVEGKEEGLITIPAGATLDGNGFTIYQNFYRKNPGWYADNNKYTLSAVWTHEMFALSAGNQITLINLKIGSKTQPVYISRSNAKDENGAVTSGYTTNDGFGIFKDAEGTNVVWNNVNVFAERYGRGLGSYNFGYYMFKTSGTHQFESCSLNASILSAGSQYGGWIYNTATTGSLTFNSCVNNGFDTITGYKDDEAGNREYHYESGKLWGSVGGGFIHTARCNVTMAYCTNNCGMTCDYSGTGYKFGGFVGEQAAGDILVQACVNNGNFQLNKITIGGGIVGRGQSGSNASYRIINCINNGDIKRSSAEGKTSNHGFGGITGHTGSTTTYEVIGCTNNGDIQGVGNVGGIVGLVEGTAALKVIKDCNNYGNITSVGCVEAAGIVGQPRTNVDITNCKNFGNIASGANPTGGIIGQGWNAGATINMTNCVNYGQIGTTAYKYAGGMMGRTNVAMTFNLTNCINYGKILTKQYSGGMIAEINSAATITMNGCKNYGEIAGVHAVAGFVGQTSSAATINMTACLNAGSIHQSSASGEGIGGFFGRIATVKAAINLESCVNTGTITGSNKNSAMYGAFGDTFGQFLGAYTVGTARNYAANELVGGFMDWTVEGAKKPVLFDCYAFGNAVPHKDAKSLTGWITGYYDEEGVAQTYAQADIPAASSVAVTVAPNNGFYGINVEIDTDASWIDTIADYDSVEEAIAAVEEILGMDFVAGNGDEAPVAVATPMLRGYQMATDGTALRVLATVNSTSYANIGFKVTVANKGNTLIDNEYRNVEKVWTAIKAAGEDGSVTKVTATDLGATYITAVTFTNLPATGTFTFTVTPTATDADGATVYTGATYVITVAHGAVTSVVQQ